MEIVKKILDKIAEMIKYLLGILLAVMLIVALMEVFRRYFIGKSFAWSEELIRYLIIWISFLGGAIGYKYQNLVFFDMVLGKLKGKAKYVVVLMVNTISLAFVSYIFVNSIQTLLKPSILHQKSVGLQLPMIVPFLAAPIGLGLMILFALYHYKVIIDHNREGGFDQ